VTTILVSPAEPKLLRDRWEVSSIPETRGVDMLWGNDQGLFGIQRKEVQDLMSSRADGRLSKELGQMQSLKTTMLIVEGRIRWTDEGEMLDGWQSMSRRQLTGMLWSVRNRGVWVEYSKDILQTIEMTEWFADWTGKKRHSGLAGRPGPESNWGKVSDKDWAVHLLTSFPGIGPGMAERIWEHFGESIPLKWEVTEEELMAVPGIGPGRARNLMKALR
jgi:ERCC4-type nuclease